MPVESGVAPVGPSVTGMPVLAPTGGSLGLPSVGAALDLRGGLPLLPAPVPGLVGPALNFIGNAPEAAAVKTEAAATQTAPTPAKAHSRPADKTPALPAKPAPGASSPAIALDRKSAASLPENGLSIMRDESPALENVQPEKAAGHGRSFFDQSNENRRGVLENPAGSSVGGGAGRTGRPTLNAGDSGSSGTGGTNRLARRDAGAAGSASGARRGLTPDVAAYAAEGETLHDAVAAAPGGVASAGAVKYFGTVAPNGDLAASAGSALLPVLGAPRPLALDLSRSGLIVRVRSALNGVMASPAQATVASVRLASPQPSTALIERGAMLEAFTVANAYADSVAVVRPLAAGALQTARFTPPSPASESSPAPLWWAWFALPLFVAAIRGIL